MEIIIVILLIIIAIKLKPVKSKPIKSKQQEENQQEEKKDFRNYYVFEKKNIMNNDEKMFYKYLRKYIKKEYIILPQIPLSNFIKCKYDWCYNNDKNPENTIFNKINRKTVDYLITDYDFNTICVIELDGNSYEIENRKQRDLFVDKTINQINIPIIHINKYSKWETEITDKLINYIEIKN